MEEQKLHRVWIILFCTGLLLGTFMTNLFFKNQVPIEELWNLDQYDAIAFGGLEQKQYFIFLLLRRGKQLIGILLLFFFTNRMIAIGVPLFFFAFTMSAFLSLETMRIGFVGLLLSVGYLFPHYICYSFGMYGLAQMGSRSRTSYQIGLGLCFITAFFFGGCYLEAFCNPIVVQAIVTWLELA